MPASLARAGKLKAFYVEGLRPYSLPAFLARPRKLEELYVEGLIPYSVPASVLTEASLRVQVN